MPLWWSPPRRGAAPRGQHVRQTAAPGVDDFHRRRRRAAPRLRRCEAPGRRPDGPQDVREPAAPRGIARFHRRRRRAAPWQWLRRCEPPGRRPDGSQDVRQAAAPVVGRRGAVREARAVLRQLVAVAYGRRRRLRPRFVAAGPPPAPAAARRQRRLEGLAGERVGRRGPADARRRRDGRRGARRPRRAVAAVRQHVGEGGGAPGPLRLGRGAGRARRRRLPRRAARVPLALQLGPSPPRRARRPQQLREARRRLRRRLLARGALGLDRRADRREQRGRAFAVVGFLCHHPWFWFLEPWASRRRRVNAFRRVTRRICGCPATRRGAVRTSSCVWAAGHGGVNL